MAELGFVAGWVEAHGWKLWYTAASFPPYFLAVYWFRAVAEQHGVAQGWVRTVIRISIALWWSHFVGMVISWMMAGLVIQWDFLLWSAAGLLLVGQFWVVVGLWRFRAPWNLYLHTAAQVATIYVTALCDDWVGRWAVAAATPRARQGPRTGQTS